MIRHKLSEIKLYPDESRVIMDFMGFPKCRFESVMRRVEGMSEEAVTRELEKSRQGFIQRHRDLDFILETHKKKILEIIPQAAELSKARQLLISAIFSMEYSIEGSALFNPSMVVHPDQSGAKEDETRFIMSVRAVGEGHLSSIGFRTGFVSNQGEVRLEQSAKWSTRLRVIEDKTFMLFDILNALDVHGKQVQLWQNLPSRIILADLTELRTKRGSDIPDSILEKLETYMQINYELDATADMPDSEKVIWPASPSECRGMEDLRLVLCEDDVYRGTYTAYNGHSINTQLLETKDFCSFNIRSLYGKAIKDKGMAIFPEQINGKYAMIGRQDGQSLTIMYSDDRYRWDTYDIILEAGSMGDYLQCGNCGSPILTKDGWLLLTHGVGAFRQYSISAILLDKDDPSKVLGKSNVLLKPEEDKREGYVPNVVYTCGMMKTGDSIIIPFAYCDSYITFASFDLDDILDSMK